MNKKMTEEQQKLVNKNIGLMYSFIKDKNEAGLIPRYMDDDFISDLALRFCRSAIKYNEKTGFQFSTYVYGGFNLCCIDMQSRKIPMYNKNHFVSQESTEALLSHVPVDEPCVVEDDTLWDFIDKADLTERELFVVKGYYFENKSMPLIGKEMGLCKESIRQIRGKAISKLRQAASVGELSLSDFYGR